MKEGVFADESYMDQQTIRPDLFATGAVNLNTAAGSKVGGGRYCLTKILGRGGMGIVWLAQDERLGTEVALKFLPPQIRYDATALDDLRRETARSRKLTHPNIMRIHDLYEAPEEDAFISMEYIDGRNLADLRLEQASRVFSWAFLKPLIKQLCAGLDYAHSERVIHRDLKPANLMLDQKGRLTLADFGIARSVSDTMSRNSISQTSGTILYMSPQQMEGELPSATDDIYAFGAMLYELLAGKPPFFTGNIMHQVRNVSPRPMQERLAELEFTNEIPAEVERVIMACLAKNASERPQTAAEVWRLLDGPQLKLIETQWETRRSQTKSLPKVEKAEKPDQRRRWEWLAAGALACGLGIWALAPATHVAGRSPKAESTQDVQTGPAASNSTVVPPPATVAEAVAPAPPPVQRAEPTMTPPQTVQAPLVEKTTVSAPAPVAQAPITTPRVNTDFPPVPKANSEPIVQVAKAVTPSPAPVPTATNAPAPAPLSKATALQLLQKGNSHVSARSKDRVLRLISERAPIGETPQSWRILYYDEKTTYNAVEVRFEAGEMERVYEPNRLLNLFSRESSKTLDLAKVRIDSDQAIRLAVAECAGEPVTVNFSELKLERGYGGLPVWNVKLFGVIPGKPAEDAALGYVIVLAEDGKVLKKDITTKSEKVTVKK